MGKFLHIIMENAGADNIRLLLIEENRIQLKAKLSSKMKEVLFFESQETSDFASQVPEGIISYVKRTKQLVVLEDARQASIYATDPYVEKNKPKSVMCIPMTHQNKLVAILYLENNLSTNVFTIGMQETLRTLSPQAAIYLVNARIYNSLTNQIAVRQKTEEDLRISEKKYRMVTDNIEDLIWSFNSEAALNFINPAIEKMLGYTPEEFLTLPTTVYFTDDTEKRMGDQLIQGLKKAKPGEYVVCNMEVEHIRKDGSHFWAEIRSKYQFKKDGKFLGVIGTTQDITERKKVEKELSQYRHQLEELIEERTKELNNTNKALQEAEDQMRSLIEASPDIVSTIDRDGRVLFLNKTMFGYSTEDAIGTSLFKIIPERFHDEVQQKINHVFKTGEISVVTANNDRTGQDLIWTETRFAPIRHKQILKKLSRSLWKRLTKPGWQILQPMYYTTSVIF